MKNRVYNFPPASGVPGTSQAAQASEAFPTSEVSQTKQALGSLQAEHTSKTPQVLQLSRRLRLSGLMLLMLLGCSVIQVFAQDIIDLPDDAITTSDTRNNMKYVGESLVNMYTGAVNVSIPVYTYKDPDFEFPISLNYVSQGFVPNMPVGSLGADWFLNTGGVITREVNGVPDEYWRMWGNKEDGWSTSDKLEWHKDRWQWREALGGGINKPYIGYTFNEQHGYYFLHRLMMKNGISNLPEIPKLTDIRRKNSRFFSFVLNSQNYPYLQQGDTRIESSPDVFSFNFMGHRGKFHMSGGDVVVYETSDPNGEYTVDLSGFGYYEENNTGINETSEIVIKTGDGYIYTFSSLYEHKWDQYGTYATTGYTPLDGQDINVICREPNMYREWKLTKITSPSGKKVHLKYQIINHSVVIPVASKSTNKHVDYQDYTGKNLTELSGVNDLPETPKGRGDDTSDSGVATHHFTTSRLKSINVGNCDINFNYNSKNISEISAAAVQYQYSEPKRIALLRPANGSDTASLALRSMRTEYHGELRSITVSHDKKSVKSITMQYDSLGTGVQKKLFLKGVAIPGTGTYKMRYYTGEFPINGTPAVDYWGFLNGNRWDHKHLMDLGELTKPLKFGEPIDLGRRAPNPNWAHLGMLNTIVYPAGGFSVFEYEPNEASTYVRRNLIENEGFPIQRPYSIKYKIKDSISSGGYRDSLAHCVGGLRVKRVTTYRQPFNADGTTSYQLNATEDSVNKNDYTIKEYIYDKGNVLNFPEYQTYRRSVQFHFERAQYPKSHWWKYRAGVAIVIINSPKYPGDKFDPNNPKHYSDEWWDFQEYLAWEADPGNTIVDTKRISFYGRVCKDPFNLPIYSNRTHIEYGRVTEKSSDGSYKVYNFTTYSDIKDRMPYRTRTVYDNEGDILDYKNRPIYDSIPRSNVDNFLKKPVSKAFLRGKLKRVESYDANGTLVAAEYYKPSTAPLKYTKEWVCADIFAYEAIRYADNYKLGSKTESQYFTNPSGRRDSVSVTTSYSYNDLGQVNEINRTHTDGTTEKTTINYLSSTTAESSSESLMVEDNMRKFPKSVYKYIDNPVLSGAGYKLVEGAKYKYSGGKPSSVYKVVSGSPDKEILEESYLYDGIGRPIQKTDKKGIRTSYVWGYKGMYPVAVIEDAPYYSSITRAILGTTILNASLDLDEGLEPNQETTLRKMTQGRVTTYKYDPLVGMTEMTDPVGRKTFYTYDKCGRLEFVKDEDGNILNKYKYSPMNDWLLFPYLRPFGDSSYVLKPGQVLDFYETYSNDKVMGNSIISNKN